MIRAGTSIVFTLALAGLLLVASLLEAPVSFLIITIGYIFFYKATGRHSPVAYVVLALSTLGGVDAVKDMLPAEAPAALHLWAVGLAAVTTGIAGYVEQLFISILFQQGDEPKFKDVAE